MGYDIPSDHHSGSPVPPTAGSLQKRARGGETERWTPSDEAQFQLLQEKRARVTAARRAKADADLRPFIDFCYANTGLAIGDKETLVECMIDHAATIRDALEPYDSGTRAVPDTVGDASC